MTPQRAKELLPIITAYAEGKEVEYRSKDDPYGWIVGTDLGFSSNRHEYRIKPEKVKYKYKRYVYSDNLLLCTDEHGEQSVNAIFSKGIHWIDKEWQYIEV